jgi:hypothetical protein
MRTGRNKKMSGILLLSGFPTFLVFVLMRRSNDKEPIHWIVSLRKTTQ